MIGPMSREARKFAGEYATIFSGLWKYYRTGEADINAWSRLLQRHCETNGLSSDRAAALLRCLRPPRLPLTTSSLLGEFSIDTQNDIVSNIKRDGYHVFHTKIPSALCDELEEFARKTPAIVEGRGAAQADRVIFNPAEPISKTYKIGMDALLDCTAMQRLIGDPIFLGIAEQYFNALPIFCGAGMWWSPAYGDEPGADAAQLFHFDYDGAPIWLKYFIYLTDVGPRNGPHVFARSSHLSGHSSAKEIIARGYVRIPDYDIEAAYGVENIVELCGERGTVLAVDTRGFHKGKMPELNYRLVAQLFFDLPHFNVHADRQLLPFALDPVLANAMRDAPKVFERLVSRDLCGVKCSPADQTDRMAI